MMNYFTLQFNDKELERSYGLEDYNKSLEYQRSQKWLWFLMIVTFVIASLIAQNYLYLGLALAVACILLVRFLFFEKFSTIFHTLLFIMILIVNSYAPLLNYFKVENTFNNYTHGVFICLFTVTLMNIMSFPAKVVVIIFVFAANSVFTTNYMAPLWTQYVTYVFFAALYIQYLFFSEKTKRETFSEIIINRKIVEFISSKYQFTIYKTSYDKGNHKLEQTRIHPRKITQDMLIQDNMKAFFREIQLKGMEEQGSQKKLDNLEKYMIEYIKNFKQGTDEIQKKETVLTGSKAKTQFYTIHIIQGIGNQEFILIFFLNQESKFMQMQEYENKLNIQKLNFIGNLFDKDIKESLGFFSWIYNNEKKEIHKISWVLKSIYSKMYKAFNDYKNLKDFQFINKRFLQGAISVFKIKESMEDIIRKVRFYDKSIAQNIEFINDLDDNQMESDISDFKQLFFNLLYFICSGSHTIKIKFSPEQGDMYMKRQIIRCQIYYQGPDLSKQTLDKLPIINPQTIEELKYNSDKKDLNLEFAISLILIRKLGPKHVLFIHQSKNSFNVMTFYLFKEVKDNSNLIQICSFNPKQHIISTDMPSMKNIDYAAKYTEFQTYSPQYQIFSQRS